MEGDGSKLLIVSWEMMGMNPLSTHFNNFRMDYQFVLSRSRQELSVLVQLYL